MKIVCLTGMHRSGTSLVSRVVNLLGVDLGPVDELMPAKPDNPRGFWENKEISAVNDDLLAALGGSWTDPPVLDDGWEKSSDLEALRGRASDIIERLRDGADGGAALAWKDPRNSLLFPFWGTVTPIDATILTVRHPAHVAASLATRDGLESELSAHLWLRYFVSAWRSDPKRLSLRFSDLFSDLDHEVDAIAEFLELPPPSAESRQAIAEFVDPSLRHHVDAPVEPGPTMSLAMTVFDLFQHAEPVRLDPVVEALHRLWVFESRIAPLTAERDEVARHRDDVARHRDEVLEERRVAVARGEELDRTIIEVAADRDRFQSELADAKETIADLHQTVADLHETVAGLDARVVAQRASIEQTELLAMALREDVRARHAELADRDRRIMELEISVRRWRIDRLEQLLRRFGLL